MEALKRKPDMGVKKSMELPDGTKIDVVGIRAGIVRDLSQDKKMSDFDRGIHLTAAKVRIDGQAVTYDDLMECFTSDELDQIVGFANNLNREGSTPPNE